MKQQVIFHIDEMQKWSLLLHNVRNLLATYDNAESGVTIEVLGKRRRGERIRHRQRREDHFCHGVAASKRRTLRGLHTTP